MKKLFTSFNILLTSAALFAAPTANEDFVVAEDARTYTNAVDYTDRATNAVLDAARGYTDRQIAAIPAPDLTPATNYTDAATNALNASLSSRLSLASQSATNYTDAAKDGLVYDLQNGYVVPVSSENAENANYANIAGTAYSANEASVASSANNADYASNAGDAAYALSAGTSYALVSSDETRDAADIFEQLDAATTNGTMLASQVATIGAHLNAEDVRFVVTNYNSVTHVPEAYVEIKLPDESWSRIWSEMTRWNYLFDYYLPTNYYSKSAVDRALADKADRAWGFYDSTTGAYAPDGYTWVSSRKIAIAANLAYQRTVTTEGAIWVLESNGTVTQTGGLTNGFFRISDDEGNSLFEIVKGNRRTIGADASSCQIVGAFTPTKLQVGYSVISDAHPTLYICDSLTTQNWKAETDADCVANVEWSGTSGAYIVEVQGKLAYPALYVKATYEVGGETYINNISPVSMQYIILNGIKYAVGTATISGNTVLTLTAQ